MTSAYIVEDLVFSYGSAPVLEVDRLEILQGEIVALVGPNGTGKTTLLHVLSFVAPPETGRISFYGDRLSRDNALSLRRRVGLLLQNPYLFHTSVLANIMWGLKIRGIKGDRARRAAREALDRVGVSHLEGRNARMLSGGEAQRVALARAIVLEPEVLLLDEPTNHLDRESVRRIEDVVLELNAKQGKTIVLATHNLAEAQAMVHRVIHIFRGQVVTASPENLFKGRLVEQGSLFDTGRIQVRLPIPAAVGAHIAVEPSSIVVSESGPDSPGPNTFSGRVVALSIENGLVSLRVDAGERFHVTIDSESADSMDLRLGRLVWLTLEESGITVF